MDRDDADSPLTLLAPHISLLTMNALEWLHMHDKDRCREQIPLIAITDGASGSRLLLRHGREISIPAAPAPPAMNVNRAGETYGATLFKVLLREAPDFYRDGCIEASLAEYAGVIATAQAARQLSIIDFNFPPDDWIE